MKRIAALLLLLPSVAAAAKPEFVFRPKRVPVGQVMHYVKSNLDGSKPTLVSVYFAAVDRIEVYKSEKGLTDSADVHATLDYDRFTIRSVDAGVIEEDGKRVGRVKLDVKGNTFHVAIGDQKQALEIPFFPVHIYNFDLMSLNAMLPHLRDGKSFTVSFAEPTFGKKDGLLAYEGTVTATRVKERVYELKGSLFPQGATLWLRADGFIQKFESETPDNPAWNSLRLERRGEETMTRAQWDEYRRTHVGTGVPAAQ